MMDPALKVSILEDLRSVKKLTNSGHRRLAIDLFLVTLRRIREAREQEG